MIPDAMYQPDSWPTWAMAVTLALTYPVRQVVLVVLLNWAASKGKDIHDPRVKASLKLRALLIAFVVTAIFATLYTRNLFLN